jgi:hypothetical protein
MAAGTSGSDWHPQFGFPIHSIDRSDCDSWRNAGVIIVVRSEGECWAGNGIRLGSRQGGLASFRMRTTWATGKAKRAINGVRKERLGKTAMGGSRQID